VQRSVPGQACRALPKAGPAAAPSAHYRLRYDHVDAGGKVSIRRAGRMHHLGVGIAHRGKEILAVTDTSSVTVIELRTGEVLSVHDIDPARDYWRNRQRSPADGPGFPSPHISASGQTNMAGPLRQLLAGNLRRYLDGQPLLNLVDHSRGY
jgi:hypothetical protein